MFDIISDLNEQEQWEHSIDIEDAQSADDWAAYGEGDC